MIAEYTPHDLWVLVWIGGAFLAYFPLEAARRVAMRRWDKRKKGVRHAR